MQNNRQVSLNGIGRIARRTFDRANIAGAAKLQATDSALIDAGTVAAADAIDGRAADLGQVGLSPATVVAEISQ